MLRPRLSLLRPGRAPCWTPGPPRRHCRRRPPGGESPGRAALEEELAAALRSRSFSEARQQRLVRGLAARLPGGADGLAPSTAALLAQFLARHRLREPRLLDCVAAFLLRSAPRLDGKALQRLVLPFSRTNYRPPNHARLFPRLEAALARKAPPLATVNVLVSFAQLRRFPQPLLRKVFSPAFLGDVTGSPCGWIMRRYLSLLDAAVALEVPGYDGPRLDPQFRVQMFEGALTADEANSKYRWEESLQSPPVEVAVGSFKGLVAEALRQLLGEEYFQQDAVLPPGYCADFLLWFSSSGVVLPLSSPPSFSTSCSRLEQAQTRPSKMQNCSPWRLELQGIAPTGSDLFQGGSPPPLTPQDCYCGLSEPSSLNSPAQTSSLPDCSSASGDATHSLHPTWNTVQGISQLLSAGPPVTPWLSSAQEATQWGPWTAAKDIHRVVLSVNDKWHYCQNSDVLVGSRAMRNRHLCLLGYHLVQLPYTELQKVCGIEEAKHYLCQRLKEPWN